MKKTFTLLALLGLGFSLQSIAGNDEQFNFSTGKRCGTAEHENHLRSKDPFYDQKKAEMERQLQVLIANQQAERISKGESPFAQYTIPLVYHVVYQNSTENVSDTKVQAMHAQLNADWARTNSDAGNTPSYFATVAVDMQIQFCLPTKDDAGNPTTGIVHKQTSTGSFSTNDAVKHTSQGGDDAWNTAKYFNVWICDLGSSLLGYGEFPPPSADYGVVIHYITVGSLTMPNASGGQFGYGRTLSHEIGHCFNLIHIWGDDGGSCSGSDQCADTPNQADATAGCPSGKKFDSCTPSGDGIQYQNYMDYTDDLCYNMFSANQKTRAQNAVFQYLTSVANSAATVCAPTGIVENSLDNNLSVFPNPSTGEISISANQSVNTMDLKVYNAIGEAVVVRKINLPSSGETKLNMSTSPEGIYLFEMKTNEGTVTKKVVINR